jgi:hypothetical protein
LGTSSTGGITGGASFERVDVVIRVSYMEIYNEMIFDLLKDDNDNEDGIGDESAAQGGSASNFKQTGTNFDSKTKHGFGAGKMITGKSARVL